MPYDNSNNNMLHRIVKRYYNPHVLVLKWDIFHKSILKLAEVNGGKGGMDIRKVANQGCILEH